MDRKDGTLRERRSERKKENGRVARGWEEEKETEGGGEVSGLKSCTHYPLHNQGATLNRENC